MQRNKKDSRVIKPPTLERLSNLLEKFFFSIILSTESETGTKKKINLQLGQKNVKVHATFTQLV